MLDCVKNMMERYKYEKFPALIVMKVICLVLCLALTVAIVLTFYQSEKYETVEDVKASRAFSAVVEATEKAYMHAMSRSNAPWGAQSFSIDNIAWIYSASFNGYHVYSKIDYTMDGKSDSVYCKTWCGEMLGMHGVTNGTETEIIDREEYVKQKSRFIPSIFGSEQKYNDLAIATVFSEMAKNLSSATRGYSNLVCLLETWDFLQDVTIHSASYTYKEARYVGSGLTKSAVFALDCTISDTRQTVYFSSEIASEGTIKIHCNSLTETQYEFLQTDYLSKDGFHGAFGNTICLAAQLDAKEGA